MEKRIKFVNSRCHRVKNKLVKNRYQQKLVNIKLRNTEEKINFNFSICFQKISKTVNFIYKEITRTNSNPLGGIAFLNFSIDEFTKLKKAIFVAIPCQGKPHNLTFLSGGEKTIASFALIMSINTILKPFIILCDEIDYNLDTFFSEKLTRFLVKWSNKERVKVLFISLKIRFIFIFFSLFFIIKTKKGSDIIKLNF